MKINKKYLNIILNFLLTRIYIAFNTIFTKDVIKKCKHNFEQNQSTESKSTKIGPGMSFTPNAQKELVLPVSKKENFGRADINRSKPLSSNKRVVVDEDDALLTQMSLKLCNRLELEEEELCQILRIDKIELPYLRATVIGLRNIDPSGKVIDRAKLLNKIYVFLDYIMNGDDEAARSWIRNHNTRLKDNPINLMKTENGLADVAAYLEERQSFL